MYEYLEENKIGSKFTNYKLQDWIFSRQRFWGEPIPMVHCEKGMRGTSSEKRFTSSLFQMLKVMNHKRW